jgi:prefoldin subunit 5
MKKIFLPAALILVFGSSVFAQTDKQISIIRDPVAAINKAATKSKKTKKNVENISLEGTEAYLELRLL